MQLQSAGPVLDAYVEARRGAGGRTGEFAQNRFGPWTASSNGPSTGIAIAVGLSPGVLSACVWWTSKCAGAGQFAAVRIDGEVRRLLAVVAEGKHQLAVGH